MTTADLIALINKEKGKYVDWDKDAQKAKNDFLSEYGTSKVLNYSTAHNAVEKLIHCKKASGKVNTRDYLLIHLLKTELKHFFGSVDGTPYLAITLYCENPETTEKYRHGKGNYISRAEAEGISRKIFKNIFELCEIVKKTNLTKLNDYVDLEKELIKNVHSDVQNDFWTMSDKEKKLKLWITKYLMLCFEDKFSSFYSEAWTNFMCKKLEISVTGLSPFARNGAISLLMNDLVAKTGVSKAVVYKILLEEYLEEFNKIYMKAKPKVKTTDDTAEAESEGVEEGIDEITETAEETATATEEKTELPDQKISDELKPYVGKNVIFYGVPGCGKSRFIKELLNGIDKCYYKRILFHPEYSYGDFIGQIIPTLDKDNKPTYEFKEGPMLQMLKLANDNENKEFFLIIEEINRGNAPAIFGDFFQLLDRNGGKSEYSINNAEIEKKLNKKEIEIPKNLTILATMNTCDQNVFTLDTAFKRRFRMTRIKNSFDKVELVIKGKGFEIEWRKLGPAINTAIVEKCNDGVSSEDKQLGAYFVHGEEIDIREFAEKVLMYLWDDVVKYDKQQLFKSTYKTLDSLIDAFCEGKNVFADSCADIKSIYDKIEEEKAKKAEGVSEIKSEEEKETPEE